MIASLDPVPGLGTALCQSLPAHISPSAAKSYLVCSLRFYFERVACLRRKVPAALHLGKSVHAALQAFHLARWRGGDDSPEAVAKAFGEAFDTLEKEEGPVNYADNVDRDKSRLDGLRLLAAYLDSPEVPKDPPKAVEVPMHENVPGLSVPLTGTIDLIEGDLTTVDFKSAAAKPDPETAALEHEIQLVSYQILLELAIEATPPSLDLLVLVKTKVPKVFRIKRPPATEQRKRRVVAILEIAVQGIAEGRFHPQPGMHCMRCQFRNECAAWLPEVTQERRAA